MKEPSFYKRHHLTGLGLTADQLRAVDRMLEEIVEDTAGLEEERNAALTEAQAAKDEAVAVRREYESDDGEELEELRAAIKQIAQTCDDVLT